MVRALDLGSSIGDRIRELIGDRSVNACAEAWGVPVTTLRQNLNGAVPRADNAALIADANSVSLEWLITGRGPKAPMQPLSQVQFQDARTGELTFVPRYDVRVSSGPGALVAAEDIFEYLAFRTSWLRDMGISPQHAVLVTNKGDSNEPRIPDGALLLLDKSKTEVTHGKFFAIRRDGDLLLKQVQRRTDGTVVLKSENKSYDPEEVHPDRVSDLEVVGRLEWFARSI